MNEKRGRKPLYVTDEEKREAARRRNREWYNRHREKILRQKKEQYPKLKEYRSRQTSNKQLRQKYTESCCDLLTQLSEGKIEADKLLIEFDKLKLECETTL